MKYTSPWAIFQRLASTHKQKNFSPEDVIEWSYQCEVDEIGVHPQWINYENVEVEVSNMAAFLPCNVYRLLDVKYKSGGYRIPGYDASDGAKVVFPSSTSFNTNSDGNDCVYMDYKGLPIDSDTNMPLILRGHEAACEAYCLEKLYYEDFLQNKITTDRWQWIVRDRIEKVSAAAKGSHRFKTRADRERTFRIMYNILPTVSVPTNLK